MKPSRTTSIALPSLPASLKPLATPAPVTQLKESSPKLESPGSSGENAKKAKESVEDLEAAVICSQLDLHLAGQPPHLCSCPCILNARSDPHTQCCRRHGCNC